MKLTKKKLIKLLTRDFLEILTIGSPTDTASIPRKNCLVDEKSFQGRNFSNKHRLAISVEKYKKSSFF